MPSEFVTPVLARLVARIDLEPAEIDAALGAVLDGGIDDVEVAGLVVALRTKGETPDELAACVRTMLRYAVPLSAPDGAIDTCGTGGDRAGTVNVSTMAGLIATAAGATVVKHGNRAATSQCGSADVLEELGVAIELDPPGVERCLDQVGFGFCFARRYHPRLRHLASVRAALGVPTTFNILGPLANPARVRRQALGVADAAMAHRMLAVLRTLGAERALVFHGDDGLDELTTTTTSTVHELLPDGIRTTTVDPGSFGFARAVLDELRGGDAARNAEIVRVVLDGAPGPARDIAVLNAAAALLVAGIAEDLAEGVRFASAAIDDGRAATVLEDLVRVSRDAAASG